MVPGEHPSPQPQAHLDRFSRFYGAHKSDRPTGHATRSVTACRMFVRSRPGAMQLTIIIRIIIADVGF